ncbi:MAG: hypothetical protein KTR20_12720 [Cellvibrionaceae bacterium]|nr:hypothetical protein [Cellvibrionaceae bacterium]
MHLSNFIADVKINDKKRDLIAQQIREFGEQNIHAIPTGVSGIKELSMKARAKQDLRKIVKGGK